MNARLLQIASTVAASLAMPAGTHAAFAGTPACGPFTTDLLSAYLQGGDPFLRGVQDLDSGWTFHRGTPAGQLLTGLSASVGYGGGFWGAADLAYSVPTAGPIFSTDPQLNQVTIYRRPPSFDGIFLHPGDTDATNGCAALRVQAPIFVTALSGNAEDLGFFDGLQVRVVKVSGGVDTVVVPFTFAAPAPAPSVPLTPTSGVLPLLLDAGDVLYVQSNRAGNYFEDWCNINVSLTFEGGPLVPAPASITPACFGRSAKIRVSALGSGLTYQWRRNGTNIVNTPNRFAGVTTSELTVSALTKPDTQDVFDCVVTSACSGFSVVSGAGRVTNLLPDINADGFINTSDLTGFLGRFGLVVSPLDPADINSDGVVNVQDLTAFLGAFGRPCP
jgi:hypothetical protein